MPIPVCIHCLKAGPLTWRPFHESWCALQSACGWTRPTHESAESGWSTPCLRATSPAAGAPSLYTESRTGWPRILQRRLRAWLSLCTARTYSPHPDAPSHLCRKHLSVLLAAYCAPTRKKPFCPASDPPSQESVKMLRRTNLPPAISAEKPKTFPLAPPANSAMRATLPQPCHDATAIHDRSGAQTQGCG